mgnify:CR=1 FL=1
MLFFGIFRYSDNRLKYSPCVVNMKIIKTNFLPSLTKQVAALMTPMMLITGVSLVGCSNESVDRVIAPQTERQLAQGTVIGFEGEYNNHAWIGIPFAKPPVGELRWKAPQSSVVFPEGKLNALKHGSACSQLAGGLGGVPGEKGTLGGSEDCLYLSVYAPKLSQADVTNTDKRLPVMVWVHGGGNKSGAGSMYDGSRLAAEQNVIVVSINYRLGPFGWFKHPALNEQSDGQVLNASGNYGTLDIIESLKWIKQNITAFGGDANNVTLFGESAGGYDTYSLMLSPIAKGLFHKAISQSGGLNLTSADVATNYIEDGGHKYSSQQAELYAHQLQSTDKSPKQIKTEIAGRSANERAQFLLSLSTQDIMNAYTFDSDVDWLLNPDLFSDGAVLPIGDPVELFSDTNTHNNIPLIAGTNKEEYKLYQLTNPELVDTYFGVYYVVKDQERYDAFAKYPSDMWKYNGVDKMAAALSQSMPNKVWGYRFDWDEQARPLGVQIDKLIGAGHGMEIPFVFGFTDKSKTWSQMYNDDNLQVREILSLRMRNYWAAFAHNGKPEKGLDGKGVAWPTWNNESAEKYLLLDSEADGGIRMAGETISLQSIEQTLLADDRLPKAEDKCRVLAGLVNGKDHHWPEDEYPEKVNGACALYPL